MPPTSNPALTNYYLPWKKRADKRKTKNLRQDVSDVLVAYVKYGMAVPTPEVLSFIETAVDNRPLIEVGSGLGYMSHLLASRGLRVTAVDHQPYSSTHKHITHAAKVNEFPARPELYHETVEMTADQYLSQHNHCKNAAIMLINFPDTDPFSWLWRYDWTLFQGDIIIASFTTQEFADRFETLLNTSGWVCKGHVDMPKYDVMTPGRSQKVKAYSRFMKKNET